MAMPQCVEIRSESSLEFILDTVRDCFEENADDVGAYSSRLSEAKRLP